MEGSLLSEGFEAEGFSHLLCDSIQRTGTDWKVAAKDFKEVLKPLNEKNGYLQCFFSFRKVFIIQTITGFTLQS